MRNVKVVVMTFAPPAAICLHLKKKTGCLHAVVTFLTSDLNANNVCASQSIDTAVDNIVFFANDAIY